MLKIVIVEDEPASARNLQYHLEEMEGGAELLVTLSSIKKSVDWFKKNSSYDLIFMDIRLSDGLSFEIFDQVNIDTPVIFITAYDDYALLAFKTTGIDYILKPFTKSDLQQAINKFKKLGYAGVAPPETMQLQQIKEIIKNAYAGFRQSFLVQFRNKLIPLSARDIAYFFTVNEISYAVTFDKNKMIIEHTLEQLQQQLNPVDFFRANRQFIVQRKAIAEVDIYFNGRLLLNVTPPAAESILVSKARAGEFKSWMNI